MKRCFVSGWTAALVCLFFCPVVFGQTFTINSRSTPSGSDLKLDVSLDVVYNVTASGLTQPVIPFLVPRNAAQADFVNATWTGTSATTNLNNLIFKIHLFEESNVCGDTFEFDLFFYSSQFSGARQATEGQVGLLSFTTVTGSQISLNHLYANSPNLPFPVSGADFFLTDGNVDQAEVTDPNNRIYFWADYNLQGRPWNQHWLYFLYTLNGQPGSDDCTFNLVTKLPNLPLVTDPIIDNTGATPIEVPQAPEGGGGSGLTPLTGVNVWDITDMVPSDPDCGNMSVREVLNFNTTSPYYILWSYGGIGDTIARSFRIYIGANGGCIALADNFGPPPNPSEFRITNFYLDSEGNIEATLDVPSAWGSATTLDSDFVVHWYLRKDHTIESLGPDSQSLSLDSFTTDIVNDPGEYYLEARIRHTGSGAVVSTTNREYNRFFSYSLDPIQFVAAEQSAITNGGPDGYLDPGEIINFPYRITDLGGGNLPSLDIFSGLVVDTNANGMIDASDQEISTETPSATGLNVRIYSPQVPGGTSNSKVVTLPFELLTAPAQPRIWFFLESETTDASSTATWRGYFSIRDLTNSVRDINAEQTLLRTVHDFGANSQGYSAQTQNPNTGSQGWAYTAPWVGDGGTATTHADDYHLLQTSVFPLGSGTNLEFLHLPQFSFNQSGGLLEYRTRITTSGSFTGWNNISALCGDCGTYDDFPFPSNPPSDLSGEMVWMSWETAPQQVSINLPNSLASNHDQIQFRFNFQDPSLVSTGTRSDGPTHWELYSLDFETSQLLADNIFRVDEETLTLNACEAVLEFEEVAPVPVNSLTFEWYESLDDLYDEVSTGDISGASGATVPFNPTANGVYNYFVRIKYLGTERILPVTVNKTTTCVEVCLTQSQIMTIVRDPNWPFSKQVTECVEIVNQLCTPQ